MNQNQNNLNHLSLNSVSSTQDAITTFQNASGSIPYGMTNDYMFRAVLQSNNKVLRGLICALLHLREDEIKSVKITNPIILGESVENKEFRLDINLLLNDRTKINLEMQVANKLNWDKRSVIYLCRSFDNLNHGQDYNEAKPVIHIGFLDYTLFDKFPEFYATYKLLNVKNHQIYSDSLTLSVVNLSRIDLATEEDKRYHIDHWAMLFKATTWEELKMLAAENEYLNEASNTMYLMSADERIRKQCLDREEYYQDLRSYERAIAERDDVIAQKDDTIANQMNALAQKDNTIAQQESQIQQLIAEINILKNNLPLTP
ncbi:MAG: Rpn family recombination-promoting nuclease/putative transposase [Lachnospiraceae bacterium]|nr:Rpn family recombination-promoting nuclease/putative transposase [Lachnospiraceae bacterium]